MYIGSHNSWSYLPAKHWWMRPFSFMAKCQSADIKTQYGKYNVMCFDLRIRFGKNGKFLVSHGYVDYQICYSELMEDLKWLDSRGCYVRVIHEVRTKKNYTQENIENFRTECERLVKMFPNIGFWCGRNLYNWKQDYSFPEEVSCYERYGSVSKLKYLIGWWPWLYAKIYNRKIMEQGTFHDILLIDYVNIQ